VEQEAPFSEELGDRPAEGPEVGRVVDQHPAHPVDHLLLDPADPAGHHRAPLPHRLGHRPAEALGEALLRHDVAGALQGIDRRRVLLDVPHRQGRQMDPGPDVGREAAPFGDAGLEHLGSLGIIGDRFDRRAGEHEVALGNAGDVVGEAPHHPDRILQPVPA
jgi:hypothetical protein